MVSILHVWNQEKNLSSRLKDPAVIQRRTFTSYFAYTTLVFAIVGKDNEIYISGVFYAMNFAMLLK